MSTDTPTSTTDRTGRCRFCAHPTSRSFPKDAETYWVCRNCGMTLADLIRRGVVPMITDAHCTIPEYTQADFKPTRQYYRKVDTCPAVNTRMDDCICWHDEGTGPLSMAREGDCPRARPGRLEWRDKPPRDITKELFPEQDSLPPAAPVKQLMEELRAVVHRYRTEAEIELASYIGALEMLKLALFQDEVVRPIERH